MFELSRVIFVVVHVNGRLVQFAGLLWSMFGDEGIRWRILADLRRRFSTGTPWEAVAGYSRAVRVGNRILVSGTTASGADGAIGLEGAGEQTRAVLGIIRDAVESLGGSMADVVRTRVYVRDIGLWESVARVHGEFFADARPACTLVEARLVDESLLVEIEAEAVVDGDEV